MSCVPPRPCCTPRLGIPWLRHLDLPPSRGTWGPSSRARTLRVPCPPAMFPQPRGHAGSRSLTLCHCAGDASSRPAPTSRLFLTQRESQRPPGMMLSRCWLLATSNPPAQHRATSLGLDPALERGAEPGGAPARSPRQHPRVPNSLEPRSVGDAGTGGCWNWGMLALGDAGFGGCWIWGCWSQ